MRKKKPSAKNANTIFSPLDTPVICEHKDTVLPVMEDYPSLPFHVHDGYEIYLFLGGNANYYVEHNGKKLERGDLILTLPFAFHCSEASKEEQYERIFINVKEEYLDILRDTDCDLGQCFRYLPPEELNLMRLSEQEIARFVELADELQENLEHPQYGAALMVRACLTQILVTVNKRRQEDAEVYFTSIMPDFIRQTIRYINEHLTEDLSSGRLAQVTHHNVDYLNRSFKSYTGTTIQQFIIAKRIARAQQALREGEAPCDACFLSGFGDYANFSRSFSMHTGLSPKKYQLQCYAVTGGNRR
ncbi:MAG: AraC family transcriptional regulator [Lachnospiraceae bacterium]|nr:AraC family transcriptional regulator [Lachnospiraceae bacterium]